MHHLRRCVFTLSLLTTIAGTGDNVDAGDGGPAILASVREVNIAAGSDGSLYVIGWHRIRRITPDGIINTIAGDGTAGFSGDNGPARFARVSSPRRSPSAPTASSAVSLVPDSDPIPAMEGQHSPRRSGTSGA